MFIGCSGKSKTVPWYPIMKYYYPYSLQLSASDKEPDHADRLLGSMVCTLPHDRLPCSTRVAGELDGEAFVGKVDIEQKSIIGREI